MPARTEEEIVFERVEEPVRPAPGPRARQPSRKARRSTPRYPLVGPILDGATGRLLRGVCGQCDTRLRVRIRSAGKVRVTCPICGHARQLEL